MITGFEGLTEKKAIARLKRQLRARVIKRNKVSMFTCHGGAFDGQQIALSDCSGVPSTADITVNGQTGRYTVRMIDDVQNRRISQTMTGRDYVTGHVFWVAS